MAYIGNSPENIQRGRRFVYEFKATAGQTVFSGTDLNNQTLDLLEENEMGVYLNGVRLADSDDYTVSGDTLTLVSAASLNDQLTVETQAEIVNISSYTRAEADARYINYDGDIVAGDLQISGEVDAGSLIVDTDVLVVDATNNRVGIGTANPTVPLHINSTATSVARFVGPNGGNLYITNDDTDIVTFQAASGDGIAFNTNGGGNERMRIDVSGNLLHDTTTYSGSSSPQNSSSSGDAGTVIEAGGVLQVGRYQNSPLRLNRMGNDGTIAEFRKDGSIMATIGSQNSVDLVINSTDDTFLNAGGATGLALYQSGGSIESVRLYSASAERLRIDDSGSLLVGKSVTTFNTAGTRIAGTDGAHITRNGNAPLNLNRTGTDGQVLGLYNDGSISGMVGVVSNNIFIGSDDTGLYFNNGTNVIHSYNGTTLAGGTTDGTVDLGQSNIRFRDIHLSGTSYANNTQLEVTATNGDDPVAVKIINNASGTGTGGRIVMGAGSGGLSQTAGVGGFYDGAGTSLAFYTATTYNSTNHTERVRINRNGNVGIGTSDPSDILTINQGGATKFIRMEGPSSGDIAGGLTLYRGSTIRASFYANPSHNLTILSETGINFRSANAERFRIDAAQDAMVHVKGETADTGTTGGSQGLSIATGGGTSCPIYFGNETNSAQKSMYMTGYWIYLRGHQNEGIRFVFSQGSGTAPRSDQYQFKYNSAYRPTGNTTWDGFSDARAKENVTNLTGALDTISQLRPVTFDWTDDYADTMNMFEMDTTDEKSYNHFSVKENGYDLDRKTSQIGFIAQEFEEVFPKSITETEMQLGDTKVEDFKTVNYDHLIPVLTKAIQELKDENDALKARIEALEG